MQQAILVIVISFMDQEITGYSSDHTKIKAKTNISFAHIYLQHPSFPTYNLKWHYLFT